MAISFTKNIHLVENILQHILKQVNHFLKHTIGILLIYCYSSVCLIENFFFLLGSYKWCNTTRKRHSAKVSTERWSSTCRE